MITKQSKSSRASIHFRTNSSGSGERLPPMACHPSREYVSFVLPIFRMSLHRHTHAYGPTAAPAYGEMAHLCHVDKMLQSYRFSDPANSFQAPSCYATCLRPYSEIYRHTYTYTHTRTPQTLIPSGLTN